MNQISTDLYLPVGKIIWRKMLIKYFDKLPHIEEMDPIESSKVDVSNKRFTWLILLIKLQVKK
jgi:hypothetical protein